MPESNENVTMCPDCQEPVNIGDWPFCPHGPNRSFNVIGDDIPGGVLIRHGLCDEVTGEPKRYYSHSAMRKEAERRGVTNTVRHITEKGTDKSKHTTRWT